MQKYKYDELINRLELEVVWEADVGEVLLDAVAAIRALQKRVQRLESAIETHRAFTESHADTIQPRDSRLWAALKEPS